MTQSAYPLQWPIDWPRTPRRRPNERYQVTFAQARDDLLHSLDVLGAKRSSIIISSNIPIRRDGIPYANYLEPQDPGIAVYWTQRRGKREIPRVLACDRWSRVRDNIRALGLSIDALRMLDRSGASQVLERAFQGFTALPGSRRHWRQVLDLTFDGITEVEIREAYRSLARERHPDVGGSHEAMAELNAARDEALKEIGAC